MMIHTIHNDFLNVGIKQVGAELCSIKNLNNDYEYVWQADAKIWSSHAPVLFPIIGSLKDGKYTFKGKEYTMPKHGMVRNNTNIEVFEKAENFITFRLKSNSDTLKQYPFEFDFLISYVLNQKVLEVKHQVINKGNKSMYFSIGGHPAFNCPVNDFTKISDYYLEFESQENTPRWLIDENGLGTDNFEDCLVDSKIINLDENIFNDDAIILKEHKSDHVTLCSKQKGKILKVSYADFNYLGIWAKPNAPYVCIEPWLGITDHKNHDGNITKKEGIIELEAGKEFKADFQIKIF